MHFDLAAIPASEAAKLLVSTVVPRPIALVTTVDRAGRVNAAPFSFFNAVSSVPPVVVLGISPGAGDPSGAGYKDTERNIRETGEFVVNLVDEAIAERMNICAVDFPTAIGELEKADLTPIPSAGVRPPRIAESPVSFECQRITGLSLGARSTLEVGRVIHIHIRDDLVDPERHYVATDKMRLVGRMHGRGWYARTSDLFVMERISFAEWQAGGRVGGGRRQAMSLRRTLRAVALAACVALAAAVAGARVHAAAAPPGSKNFTPPASVPNYFSNESGPFQGGATTQAAQPGTGPAFAVPAPRSRVAATSRRGARHQAWRAGKARGHVRVARGKASAHRKFVHARAAMGAPRTAKAPGPRTAHARHGSAGGKTVAAKGRPAAPSKNKHIARARG